MIVDVSKISNSGHAELASELELHRSLSNVLAWAATKLKTDLHPHIVAEVVTQDEFTHDVIVPYRDLFLVYDTT